jgi:tetratricopeptide (TPR) repeat protein
VLAGLGARRWAQPDSAGLFLRAQSLVKAGRFAEAGDACENLARLRQPDGVDRLLRAEVQIGLDRLEAAESELAQISSGHPIAPLALLRAGQLAVRQGRLRAAENAFLSSIRLLPRAVQPHKELVYIYSIQHRQAELDAQLADLLKLDALDFQIVLYWSKTRHTVWNPKADLAALEKYVASDPADRWSRLALVEALRRLDRLDEAQAVVAELPESDPEVRAERVSLLMARGDFARAESLLNEGPSDHPELARLRGQLALRRRDGSTALHHFQIAHRSQPFDHMTLTGLGTALRMIGQPDAARPYLEAARRHEDVWALVARAATPEGERDPSLPRQLGMACAAIGRASEARAWLKLAIRNDPLDESSQRMLFDLERPGSPPASGESKSRENKKGQNAGAQQQPQSPVTRPEGAHSVSPEAREILDQVA